MAINSPSPALEGTFLTRAFIASLPFTVLLLAYFTTKNGNLVLPLIASAALACWTLLITMLKSGYSHDGLFRAKFMRGGTWSAVYWFHLLIVSAATIGITSFFIHALWRLAI
ncbi:hypothetical protein [Thermomonas brevis]